MSDKNCIDSVCEKYLTGLKEWFPISQVQDSASTSELSMILQLVFCPQNVFQQIYS